MNDTTNRLILMSQKNTHTADSLVCYFYAQSMKMQIFAALLRFVKTTLGLYTLLK